jgi:hypothetical protein
VFAFLKALTADYGRHGLKAPPECFPKQPMVAPPGQCGQFGNWLRLPGKHHSRQHWSTVWDGSRWLGGANAVVYLLTFRGDPVDLLPSLPPPAPRPVFYRRAQPSRGGSTNLANRIASYLRRLPNRGEGQGRDDVAYGFACWLVRDLDLGDSVALEWLEIWDARNSPPKGRARLLEILTNARKYGRNPYGSGERQDDRPRVTVRLSGRPGHSVIIARSGVFQ